MVGEKQRQGRADIREWMKQMEGMEPPKFSVSSLIAEGDMVVCSGDMTMEAPEDCAGEYGYCDIYRFSGDKIAELTSFVVMTRPKSEERSAAG